MSNLEQYKKMHDQGLFPGHSTAKNSEQIKALIDQYGAKTLLDYGSGKGLQYKEQKLHEAWGVEMPTLYDPAVPGINMLPNAFRGFNGVICCDVLEHLEGKEIEEAIFNCRLMARKFAFFSISTRAAKKTLPDGRNAHLTIRPADWWRGVFEQHVFVPTKAPVHLVFDGD